MKLDNSTWDRIHKEDIEKYKNEVYDKWIDRYVDIISTTQKVPIVDIGCGLGKDTEYLINKGYNVIATDFSNKQLNT